MKRLIIHDDAKAEFDAAMSWYEDRQTGLGLSLHDAVGEVLERIRANPIVGTPYKSTDYRFCRTSQFPYVVYYVELDDSIWIAAIAHSRRRPDYWKQRVTP